MRQCPSTQPHAVLLMELEMLHKYQYAWHNTRVTKERKAQRAVHMFAGRATSLRRPVAKVPLVIASLPHKGPNNFVEQAITTLGHK